MKSNTTKTSYFVTKCRYCGSDKLTKYISLGNQPPSNSFIAKNLIHTEVYYPLDVYLCRSCYLSQLGIVVSPKIIFDEYLYLSSSSVALKNHYAKLAQELKIKFKLKKNDIVVDIGCNDGILLHGYDPELTRVGVEPSKVSKIAKSTGLNVIEEFFTQKTARKIAHTYGKAKIITATNVFAHIDNTKEFTKGVYLLLDDNGVFVIEVPYIIDMIDKLFFDTIYHEHLSYLSLTPLVPFFKKINLEVFDIERISLGASGPAIRIFVGKEGNHKIKKTVTDLLSFEDKWGIKNIYRYKRFEKNVEKIKLNLWKYINNIRKKNASLGGYGAPAKGNTLLNFFGINRNILTYIAETNKLKQGLLTPGSHIPIISEEKFLDLMPDYALLLSWNYLDFFLEKSQYIKKGGKFLVPLPRPHIQK